MDSTVKFQKLKLSPDVLKELQAGFVAFDTETTGLNPNYEKIVELGAVKYMGFEKKDYFSSLVNAEVRISPSITAINHITNAMLASAPLEAEIYPRFIEYMKEAMNGELIIVGHNADFDMRFLSKTMTRLGYSGFIRYVDTLQISRTYLPNLPNHKQGTIADYFGVINPNAHRAYEDADTCAQILIKLIKNLLL